jgi:hypothetical protein
VLVLTPTYCVDIFKTHESSLKAFVDMAWHMGAKHNITGKEFPHTIAFYMLALDTAKFLEYEPQHALSSRRSLQSCQDASCGMSGGCTGSDCRGMCGPSCTWCWDWICNTCCWMQFCESHDDCCSRVGMTGSACWVSIKPIETPSCMT